MDPTLKAISEHLPYFGYTLRYEEGVLKTVSAPQFMPQFWVVPTRRGVTFRALYTLGPEARSNRSEFLAWVNEANQLGVISRFIALDVFLCIEAWFPPYYERDSFAIFFQQYLADIAAPAARDLSTVLRFFPAVDATIGDGG
jgi:hypothetical protein